MEITVVRENTTSQPAPAPAGAWGPSARSPQVRRVNEHLHLLARCEPRSTSVSPSRLSLPTVVIRTAAA